MEPENALIDSIKRKGEHSYYYAHAPRPLDESDPITLEGEGIVTGGPPKLINTQSTQEERSPIATILRNYSWCDEDEAVTIYIPFDHAPNMSDIDMVFNTRSFDLTYTKGGEVFKLAINKLKHPIDLEKCRYRVRNQKIVLTLKKQENQKWQSLADSLK